MIYPARFFVARATRVPVIGALVERWLFWGDDMTYLPASRTIPIHESLAAPEQVVMPFQVVEHFIEQANVHWVMDACICREGARCEDYPRDLGCLFLGEAALGINPRLGRRVTKEEAREHARRCREAGLIHLIGRHKLDTVWLGVEPGERLLTICNCCPCCCLWAIIPFASSRLSEKLTRMEGVTVAVSDRCVGCGTCAQGVCFVDAIRLADGRAVIGDACRGCGRCAGACPQDAIEVRIEHSRFEQAIARIASQVDVS
jgi:ferredoxin